MKKFIFILLSILLIFTFCGCSSLGNMGITGNSNKKPSSTPTYNNGNEENSSIHVLAIGNSFSDDGLWPLYDILKDLGYKDVIVANLYIGGCTVETHKNNLSTDAAIYEYHYNKDGNWQSIPNYKASTALEAESWDYVSLQESSIYSGLIEKYVQSDINYIYNYARSKTKAKNKDTKFVWQMTWAYQQNSTHSAFPNYNSNQMTMYNGILNCVQNVILNNDHEPIVVPSGTAIQNLRTTFLGDNVTRDGYHLNFDYGRYTAALTWAIKLTGKSIENVAAPSTIPEIIVPLCKESAENACETPYNITNSLYTVNNLLSQIDFGNMTKLNQNDYIIGNGFYNSMDENNYITPYQSNSDFDNSFITTILFTKQTLPVGSVIILGNGYKYRPEGWVNSAVQTNRCPLTTQTCVVVTNEWWGNYIYRAFNISKEPSTVLKGAEYTNALSNFAIFVPNN